MANPQIKVINQREECVEFELSGLHPLGQDSANRYDVFIEFGDGSYASYFIHKDENAATSDKSAFSYKYKRIRNDIPVQALMKGIYGSDGDPRTPDTTVDVANIVGTCTRDNWVTNKLIKPNSPGVGLTLSHMPMYGEDNIFVIHFDQVSFPTQQPHFVFLFYNSTNNQEWSDVIPSSPRIFGGAVPFAAGNTQELQYLLSNDTYKQRYDKFIAFKLPDALPSVNEQGVPNIFVSLNGDIGLSTPGKKNRKVSLAAVHFYGEYSLPSGVNIPTSNSTVPLDSSGKPLISIGTQLSDIDIVYLTEQSKSEKFETLAAFHDPNYIAVHPQEINRGQEISTIWEYGIEFSNEGEGSATNITLNCDLDIDFFDFNTIVITQYDFNKPEIVKNGSIVSFVWEGIVLPGSTSRLVEDGIIDIVETKGQLKFTIKSKPNPLARNQVEAKLTVEMSDGDNIEITPAEQPAICLIKDLPDNQRTAATVANYRPILLVILIFCIIIFLLLLGIIFFCCG